MADSWCAYHVENCRHALGGPKDKLVIIVCRAPKPMGFLINTHIPRFIEKDPELMATQARIGISGHRFLDGPSYVACKDLYEFEEFELNHNRGPVSKEAKKAIQGAVANATTLEPVYTKLILEDS